MKPVDFTQIKRAAELKKAQTLRDADFNDELAPRRVQRMHQRYAVQDVLIASICLKATQTFSGDTESAKQQLRHALIKSKELHKK
ncbi:hypothetical protein ACFLZH_01260 [Patescibacteria group bacterium]